MDNSKLTRVRELARDEPERALTELHPILSAHPEDPEAVALLEEILREGGDEDWRLRARFMLESLRHPDLQKAAELLADSQFQAAERLLAPFLLRDQDNVPALRLVAELATRLGKHSNAAGLHRRITELEPDYIGARYDLALSLYRSNNLAEAIAELAKVLDARPQLLPAILLNGVALGRLGRHEQAITSYAAALDHFPNELSLWMPYGHSLRSIGRLEESVAAYRRAIEISPLAGAAWWSLANLKTVRLTETDIKVMSDALAGSDLQQDDRIQIHFALGKALEDQAKFRQSFEQYSEGNRLRQATLDYDPAAVEDFVTSCKALFSSSFFGERASFGSASTDPIFVVGMPRAGSTLVEQILASHPQIEGVAELSYIPGMAEALGGAGVSYAEALGRLTDPHSKALADQYLQRSSRHRSTARPFFVDKNPNNWMHAGLIKLVLPNARIIDVRRHPLGCGLSNFKQHFARGQPFSYSLENFGRYYRSYVALMSHFDEVAPGTILRVSYEELVSDTEQQIRSLLQNLGLPFDESCLRFYENARAVRTPSSEQVRQPINRQGVDRWSDFEPWLGPLKESLGDVLTMYPDAPPNP